MRYMRVLGQSISADEIKGEHLPAEASRLVVIDGTDWRVRQCPICGNYYEYQWRVDNDIIIRSDIEELRRITVKEADEIKKTEQRIIENDKKRVKEFSRKFRRRCKDKLLLLSDDERSVIDFLLQKTWEGDIKSNIEKELGMKPSESEPVINSLRQKELITVEDHKWCIKITLHYRYW